VIEVRGISKSFSGVTALQNVSLLARAGAVHGVLGENGAGKSTLMNILFGLLHADTGQLLLDGNPININSPRTAQRLGIGMVHQHFKLVGPMTVAENFALAVGRGAGLIHQPSLAARMQQLASTLNWKLDPKARIDQLTVGQQQRIEIIKALATGGRVLILDEPTAVLTPGETDELLPALRRLAQQGTAVLFISHKLNEVRKVCDDVTVLRRGHVITTGPMGEMTREQLAEKMIGSPVRLPQISAGNHPRGPSLLETRDLSVIPRRGDPALKHVSFNVHAGEIVGIAGVDGNGQSTLADVLLGTQLPTTGHIKIAATDATAKPIRWRLAHMAYIPEDRQRDALALPLSVQSNMLLKAYRDCRFSRHGFLKLPAWRHYAQQLRDRFDVRTASLADPVGSLSGGNQQKVVLARELSAQPRVVLAVNPTRGLDIGATAFVLQQLLDARARGAAILLIHSDLDELLAVSDRVLVMFEGHLRDSAWPAAGRERIGQLMLGAA